MSRPSRGRNRSKPGSVAAEETAEAAPAEETAEAAPAEEAAAEAEATPADEATNEGESAEAPAEGAEEAAPEDVSWAALGAWLAFDLNAKAGLALRADYLSDPDAVRTGGAFGAVGEHNLMSFTATLNLKSWPNALIRPEFRFDSSNQAVFDGEESQITLALSAAYIF